MSKEGDLRHVLERIKATGSIEGTVLANLNAEEKKLIHHLVEQGLMEEALQFLKDTKVDQEWERVSRRIEKAKKPFISFSNPILRYAAIFAGLLAVTYFLIPSGGKGVSNEVVQKSITLKIGDDKVQLIKQGEEQEIVSSSGQVLGKQTGNKITYYKNPDVKELVFNELEVPYGEIFNVELSDGTQVHLNSGSTMRYPVKFLEGKKRIVCIKGEAYFKVAKDKEHPFIVKADDVAIEVLGTEFNISSYQEDSEIKTVLVEGAVSMSNAATSENVILAPGHKAAWNRATQSTKVELVDVDLHTGWIKGELIFRKSSFAEIAKKLERLYNVKISNNNVPLANKKFNARFSVDIESIEDVMKSINEIQPIQYQITDQNIIIN